MQLEPHHKKTFWPHVLPSLVVFVILGGVIVYELGATKELREKTAALESDLAATKATTIALTLSNNQLSQKLSDLRLATLGISDTLASTQQNIDAVKTQVGGVEQTVGAIGGAVGTLQKLSQVDPEILKKYSKVYFMNENYVPAHLIAVPQEYIYSDTRPEQILTNVSPYLKNLLDAAKADGITLFVKSGYRSFAEQKSLKSNYSVIYGKGTANSFSAEQGYSEHQLGTAVDFITTGLNGKLDGFGTTPSYKWLLENAHRYGFILSYPKSNTYYVYEPWHWRFVGVKLATFLHDAKVNFYDLDQRDIDKYLASTFD